MQLRWLTGPLRSLRPMRMQPQRTIGALAFVLGLGLCVLVANDLLRDYEQQFSVAEAKTSGLTQLLEEHARQSMRRVELSMSLAAQEVQALARDGKRINVATGTRLRALLPQDGLIASFAVLDANGKVVASTLTEDLSALPSASDRDFYLAQHSASTAGLFIGAAVKSPVTGLWIIPVSIKLGESLDGYLLSTVDPEYFQRLYLSIDTGDDGSVTLFTTQGWAIARWPFNSELAQVNWLDTPLFKTHIAAASVGSQRETDRVDATPRVYSYRVLSEYPLVVSLAVSMDEALMHWRQRAVLAGVGLLLTLIFIGTATVLLIAQLRRRLEAESALKLTEISVLKSSLPTLWIGPDGRVLRVNQAACDLHGYSKEHMLGMSVPDLNPDMPWSSWPAHWERLRQRGRMNFETVHRNRQGQDLPVEVDLNFLEFELFISGISGACVLLASID